MSSSPIRSVPQIIREVNQSLDIVGGFNKRVIEIAIKALAEIDKENIASQNKMELCALASRISVLCQNYELKEPTDRVSSVLDRSDYDRTKDISSRFLLKANITPEEAREIESILSNVPDLRRSIIQRFPYFMKEKMKIEDRNSILKIVKKETVNSFLPYIKLIAKLRPNKVVESIKSYGVTDQNILIEIALIAAAEYGSKISEHIQHYGITDQNALIEIAMTASSKDGTQLSMHIKNYGITDQNALIKIANEATSRNGSVISPYIKNFGIADQSARIAIAKTAATKYNSRLSEFIKEYDIVDQTALIEIAKTAAGTYESKFSEFIKEYGISDQNTLIELAKIEASRNSQGLSRCIENYGITSENARIEIAKIAAAQRLPGVSKYIKNYGIADQNARIEIAKIVASFSGHEVSLYIKNYEITDEQTLIEIAKRAANQVGGPVSCFIKEYGISDQRALIEIAKIAASHHQTDISQFIKDYEITDQNVLIEIAKIAAARQGSRISIYINEYGITDQNALVEIAKIVAAQSSNGISPSIKNYGITDQNVLIEIAKIAAARNGDEVARFIQEYEITNERALIEIAKIALQKDPKNALNNINNFKLNKSTNEYKEILFYPLLFGFAFKGREFLGFEINAAELSSFIRKSAEDLAEATESLLEKKKEPSLFSCFLKVYAKQLLPEDIWSESERKAVIAKIDSYRNSSIGAQLAFILFQQILDVEFKENYRLFTLEITEEHKVSRGLTAHKILPAILLAKWVGDAKKEMTHLPIKEKVIFDLKDFLNSSRKEFRDNFSSLLQSFLLTSLDLDKTGVISSSRKLEILSAVCRGTNYLKGLTLIRVLLGRKQIDELNTAILENPTQELKTLFEAALIKDPYLDLSGIANLADKYLGIFENTRTPFCIEIYATSLRGLDDERVQSALNRFVRSVLDGTFEEERYHVDKSIHLEKIKQYDQETGTHVLRKWKELTFETPLSYISAASEEPVFSFENFFKEKLADGHGRRDGTELLPYLSTFLKSDSVMRQSVLADLIRDIETKGRLDAKRNKLNEIQKICIDLILEFSLSKKEQIKKLETINSIVFDLELASDLKGLVKSLKETHKSFALEKVEFCSGWEDLFLSGTEVPGSCQRIDGSPNLNKCLLAYCLDGKNSMMAVKGADGKILARSMLRLLWNKTDSKPALFLDRLYPDPCPKERSIAIEKGALDCARELGLELFIARRGSLDHLSRKIIESLGSSCPFEYADRSSGVMSNGVYTLNDVEKI